MVRPAPPFDPLPLISSGEIAKTLPFGLELCVTLNLRQSPWSSNMTVVERTSAGLQTVIPGCERRTLPRSTTRVDESGQGLLHFYKPSGLREQLAKRADAPLLPKRGQKPLQKSGLFVS
jgi:hypothetical protein